MFFEGTNDKIEKSNMMSIPKNDIFFLYLMLIFSFLTVINSSLLPSTYPFLGNIRYILLFFQLVFCIRILCDFFKRSWKRIMSIILVFLILLIGVINSGLNALIITGIVVICFSKFKFENILLFLIFGQLLGVIFVVSLAYSGVIENLLVVRLGVERHALGFLNPNTVSNYLFTIALKIIYLAKNRHNWIPLFLSNIILFMVMLETNSRTSLILMILFNLIYIFYFFMKIQGYSTLFLRLIYFLDKISFIGLFILSIISAILFSYSNPIMVRINQIFSNRISSAGQFYQQYGFSFIGQKVELVSTYKASQLGARALILDNGYLQLLIIYGLVATIIFSLYWFNLIKNFKNKSEHILLVIALIYTIYGFNSGLFLSWEYNFLLFYSINNMKKGDKNENSNTNISGIQ